MNSPFNLLFSGDLSFSGIFKSKVRRNDTIFDDSISAALKSADFVITNLEGPVTDQPLTEQNAIDLRQPLNGVAYLAQRCNPVFNLANNHTLDCGLNGLQETTRQIESAGGRSFGADKTAAAVYLTNGEVRIALIAVLLPGAYSAEKGAESVFTFSDSGYLQRQVHEASEKAEYVILNVHGGEEYTRFPSPRRRKILRRLARLQNVDIIIAHHSHVFQGIENVNETLIFYSLGNFVFDLPKHRAFPATRQSALVQFHFDKEGFQYELLPAATDIDAGLVQEAGSEFLEEIKRRSDFSAYYRNWLREAHSVLYADSGQNEPAEKNTVRLKERSFLQLVFSASFYARSFRILRDQEKRSSYFGALLYRFLKKTGFIN